MCIGLHTYTLLSKPSTQFFSELTQDPKWDHLLLVYIIKPNGLQAFVFEVGVSIHHGFKFCPKHIPPISRTWLCAPARVGVPTP